MPTEKVGEKMENIRLLLAGLEISEARILFKTPHGLRPTEISAVALLRVKDRRPTYRSPEDNMPYFRTETDHECSQESWGLTPDHTWPSTPFVRQLGPCRSYCRLDQHEHTFAKTGIEADLILRNIE